MGETVNINSANVEGGRNRVLRLSWTGNSSRTGREQDIILRRDGRQQWEQKPTMGTVGISRQTSQGFPLPSRPVPTTSPRSDIFPFRHLPLPTFLAFLSQNYWTTAVDTAPLTRASSVFVWLCVSAVYEKLLEATHEILHL